VKGVIGSAAWAVINASGYIYSKVPSAPGNHAKIMIIDDEVYVVGSDNLYQASSRRLIIL
jgi:phosphatidylserine/phosphatidylglycerophosphate/cardiolipin synthase-like enzyme